jgi:phage replication O-like protein O
MNNEYIPNAASIPNILFDYWMAKLTPGEFKLLMAIARKTYGWHKKKDRISLRQLTELTGLNKSAVIRSTENLVEIGLVLKFKAKGEYGDLPNEYEINVDYVKKGVEKNEGGSRLKRQGGVALCDTGGVASCDTQNPLLTKSTIQKEREEAAPPISVFYSKNLERAEHVHTTNEEHAKLVKDHGEEKVGLFYSILSDWKKDTPRSKWKKCDYRSILRWVVNAASESKNKNITPTTTKNNKTLSEKAEKKCGSSVCDAGNTEVLFRYPNTAHVVVIRYDDKDFMSKFEGELGNKKIKLKDLNIHE